MALAQTGTQHDRIDARGQVKTDKFLNRATILLAGATPDVSNGNVFKTNNPGIVTVTNFLNGSDTQLITVNCGDANTTIQNNANVVNTSGADFVCGVNKTISYVYDAAQVAWIQSGTGSAGGGGGGSPGAPANCLQKNNGSGGFGCASESSDGTNLIINENPRIKGPNPYVDVTAFGVRAVVTVPSTTASITSGTTAATLAAASTFQNGDGIVVYGAGPTVTMSTPSAPTVTPSLVAGSIRADERVASIAGATTYSYVVVARNKKGALTTSSATGTTSTGLATLGAVVVNITSLARANNIVTVTTSAPNDLVAGAAFYIQATTDFSFEGAFLVTSRIDSTHFTYTQGIDTREGATTSATGGNVTEYVHNHLSWPAVTGAFEYEIYGRIGGSLGFIGTSRPLELTFDDYGATIMGTPYRPSYVSSTPPVSATNEPLVTTIASGAGTTSLVLANAATNTVSGATALFDDGVNLLAAKAAAAANPIYFPSDAAGGCFVSNSYTNFSNGTNPNGLSIWQAGCITLNETLELPNGTIWNGDIGGSGAVSTAWNWSPSRLVRISAFPGVWFSGGLTNRVKGVGFFGNTSDQNLLVLLDGSGGFSQSSFEYCVFSTSSASNLDYMGIGFEIRGAALNMFDSVTFNAALPNGSPIPLGLWAPSLYNRGDLTSQPAGGLFMHKVFFTPRGITTDLTYPSSSNIGTIDVLYSQGLRTPLVTAEQGFGGTLPSAWRISNTTLDTTFAPHYANLSTSTGNLILDNITGNVSPAVTGNPIPAITSINSAAGPNTGVISGSSFTNNNVTVNGSGTFQYGLTATIAAPGVAVSAGGAIPVGAHTYIVQFIDVNGNYSPSSAAVVATTSGGNQTVTVTRPMVPAGMVSWVAYRDGAQVLCSPTAASTTTLVDTVTQCGNSIRAATAGVSIIGSTGISSPQLTLVNSGSVTTVTGDGAANRTVTYPAASGTVCLTAACVVNGVTINGDAALTSSPRAVPPVFFPGALTTTWTGASWTLDKAITVTRVQSAAKVAPAGCSTSAIVRVTDGSTPINLTINAATNDSGVITQNYSAGATLTVAVQTAAAGCTTSPGDLNVSIQSRMQ